MVELLQTRDRSFDIAKGIGMFLVVIGHMATMKRAQPNIFSFHMPLFFIISGYFFKQTSFKKLISKKARSLLIPYIFTGLMIALFDLIKYLKVYNKISFSYLILRLFAIFFASSNESVFFGIPSIGPIWFLIALFFAEIFYHFFSNKQNYTTLLVIISFLFGVWSHNHLGIFPLSIQPALCITIFLHIGYLCREHKIFDNISWQKVIAAIIIWILSRQSVLWEFPMDIGRTYFNNAFVTILGACSGSYVIICISKSLTKFLNNAVIEVFHYWGRYSLVFLCLHSFELSMIPWSNIFSIIPIEKINFQNYIIVILKLVWATSGIIISLRSKYARMIFGIKNVDALEVEHKK